MKTATIAVTALAMITASVNAELGETAWQFESRKPIEVKRFDSHTTGLVWKGKRGVHGGVFIDDHCVTEFFYYNDQRPWKQHDFEFFLHSYLKSFRWTRSQVNVADHNELISWLLNSSGQIYAVVIYNMAVNKIEVWSSEYYNSMHSAVASERPDPQPQRKLTSEDTDCEIVASEMYQRLKKAGTPWVNILRFRIAFADGRAPIGGHAVCVWKLVDDGNVQVYDKTNGTVELDTASTTLDELIPALAALYSRGYNTRVTLTNGNFAIIETKEKSLGLGTVQIKP